MSKIVYSPDKPNDCRYTSDYDKKNEFNIEQFLSRRLKLKAGDEFVVVDAD